MSSASPSKTNSTKLFFSKSIRLNLNSKFLPQDFFPQSISQLSKSKKKSQKQNQCFLSRKQSLDDRSNQEQIDSQKQARNFELLRKRLVKIQSSSPSSSEHDSKKKVFLKRVETPKKGERKVLQKTISNQSGETEAKNSSKGCSKKLMDYMRKMKDVINIDIKFEQDLASPLFDRRYREPVKYDAQQVETDDSPKIQRFRPKSEITSRQRLLGKEKVKMDTNKLSVRPLKIKVRETGKLMRESRQKIEDKKNNRYNKFVDIQLNEEGMLTFYGSPDKEKKSYDSRKYTARSSLPKLQK